MQVARQFLILQMIPKAPRYISVQEVANRLREIPEYRHITNKTVSRDLMTIASLFAIDVATDTKPHRYSLLQTPNLPARRSPQDDLEPEVIQPTV